MSETARVIVEHNLQQIAFPKLSIDQISRLKSCAGATLRLFDAGQTLFKVGERNPKFFVVKSGAIDILDESSDAPKLVATHHPGGFTGEVAHLTGEPAVVAAVAQVDSEVYEITAQALRHVLNQCPDLSDVILQAFIARRQLASIEIKYTKTGEERMLEVAGVFSFIGAAPRTDWLPPEIERNAKGFVKTGAELHQSPRWSSVRQPFLLETSRAGVFAAGDVRAGSVKRVASAVGEGAMAVQFVHEYLKSM